MEKINAVVYLYGAMTKYEDEGFNYELFYEVEREIKRRAPHVYVWNPAYKNIIPGKKSFEYLSECVEDIGNIHLMSQRPFSRPQSLFWKTIRKSTSLKSFLLGIYYSRNDLCAWWKKWSMMKTNYWKTEQLLLAKVDRHLCRVITPCAVCLTPHEVKNSLGCMTEEVQFDFYNFKKFNSVEDFLLDPDTYCG